MIRQPARRAANVIMENAPQKAFAIYAQKSVKRPGFRRKATRFSDFSRFSTDMRISYESRIIGHIIRLIFAIDARRAGSVVSVPY
jgi:hypothetical protein